MKYGLSENSIKAIHGVLAQNPNIETAVLYGSRAKGNYREGFDIDLALTGDELDLSQMLRIAAMLDDLMIPYKVDVALLHHINNAELKDHIRRRGGMKKNEKRELALGVIPLLAKKGYLKTVSLTRTNAK